MDWSEKTGVGDWDQRDLGVGIGTVKEDDS